MKETFHSWQCLYMEGRERVQYSCVIDERDSRFQALGQRGSDLIFLFRKYNHHVAT